MTRHISDAEMARRQRVAQLREDLAQFMGNRNVAAIQAHYRQERKQ